MGLLILDLIEQLVQMLFINVSTRARLTCIENIIHYVLIWLTVDGQKRQVVADTLLVNFIDLFVLFWQDILPQVAGY